jgi:hypothetical protein
MLGQPHLLNSSASAPNLSGGPAAEEERRIGYPPKGTVTRPGKTQQPSTGNQASFGQSASVALYAVPSYSSLYPDPQDLEPGPGSYDIPGSCGFQYESQRDTLPLISLTAKHDRAWARVMITKDHNEVFKARDTPGPGIYGAPQPPESQARVRIGTGKRKPLNDTNFRAPGPVYEVRGAPDEPPVNIRFGKADRFSADRSMSSALESAGPGQYETGTVFDGVNLAKSFGASHRAYDSVRFPGGDKQFKCTASPGPGPMRQYQNDSVQMSFGRAERLPGDKGSKRAPGPGAYDNHLRAYPFSKNMITRSFGRPQPRGRLNWSQLAKMQNSTWGIN